MLKLLYPSDNNSYYFSTEAQIEVPDIIKKTHLRFTDPPKLCKHSKLTLSDVAF